MRKRIERTQKGTMVQKRTMLQVWEQWLLFDEPLVGPEPSGESMVASVAPIVGGRWRGCRMTISSKCQATMRVLSVVCDCAVGGDAK